MNLEIMFACCVVDKFGYLVYYMYACAGRLGLWKYTCADRLGLWYLWF